jgi:hypothetical protein
MWDAGSPAWLSFTPVIEGREIVSIEWYSHRPDWHELAYSDGDYERVPGGLVDAAALAEALKMELVTERGDTVQWDRKT